VQKWLVVVAGIVVDPEKDDTKAAKNLEEEGHIQDHDLDLLNVTAVEMAAVDTPSIGIAITGEIEDDLVQNQIIPPVLVQTEKRLEVFH